MEPEATIEKNETSNSDISMSETHSQAPPPDQCPCIPFNIVVNDTRMSCDDNLSEDGSSSKSPVFSPISVTRAASPLRSLRDVFMDISSHRKARDSTVATTLSSKTFEVDSIVLAQQRGHASFVGPILSSDLFSCEDEDEDDSFMVHDFETIGDFEAELGVPIQHPCLGTPISSGNHNLPRLRSF